MPSASFYAIWLASLSRLFAALASSSIEAHSVHWHCAIGNKSDQTEKTDKIQKSQTSRQLSATRRLHNILFCFDFFFSFSNFSLFAVFWVSMFLTVRANLRLTVRQGLNSSMKMSNWCDKISHNCTTLAQLLFFSSLHFVMLQELRAQLHMHRQTSGDRWVKRKRKKYVNKNKQKI